MPLTKSVENRLHLVPMLLLSACNFMAYYIPSFRSSWSAWTGIAGLLLTAANHSYLFELSVQTGSDLSLRSREEVEEWEGEGLVRLALRKRTKPKQTRGGSPLNPSD